MKQVPVVKVLKLLLYKLPAVMVQSFTISILFATLLSLSQLAKNNELTALRLGGISLHRLLLPFLITALVISITSFVVNDKLVPWTNHQAENIVRRIILQEGLPDLQEGSFFRAQISGSSILVVSMKKQISYMRLWFMMTVMRKVSFRA